MIAWYPFTRKECIGLLVVTALAAAAYLLSSDPLGADRAVLFARVLR